MQTSTFNLLPDVDVVTLQATGTRLARRFLAMQHGRDVFGDVHPGLGRDLWLPALTVDDLMPYLTRVVNIFQLLLLDKDNEAEAIRGYAVRLGRSLQTGDIIDDLLLMQRGQPTCQQILRDHNAIWSHIRRFNQKSQVEEMLMLTVTYVCNLTTLESASCQGDYRTMCTLHQVLLHMEALFAHVEASRGC